MRIFGFNLPSIPNPFNNKPLEAPSPQGAKAYNEFIRRVSPEEKKQIERRLYKIIHSPSFRNDVNALEIALQTQNWSAPTFQNKNYPYLALAALHEGMITSEALATILIYYSAQTETSNIKTVPLFIRGEINEEAKRLIIETWPSDKNMEGNISAFFEKMRQAPPSQQQFFLIPYDQDKEYASGDAEKMTFAGDIHSDRVGFNTFGACSQSRHMLPSVGMMQSFLEVTGGPHAVKINPVIGLSSEKDIHDNGLNNERDMGLLFPDISFPLYADGSPASGFRFWYHDFYHSSLCTLIPPKHRHLFIEFADTILSHDPRDSQLKDAWNAFVDMEMVEYRPQTSEIALSNEEALIDAFWISASRKLAFDKPNYALNIPQEILEKAKKKYQQSDLFIQRGITILNNVGLL